MDPGRSSRSPALGGDRQEALHTGHPLVRGFPVWASVTEARGMKSGERNEAQAGWDRAHKTPECREGQGWCEPEELEKVSWRRTTEPGPKGGDILSVKGTEELPAGGEKGTSHASAHFLFQSSAAQEQLTGLGPREKPAFMLPPPFPSSQKVQAPQTPGPQFTHLWTGRTIPAGLSAVRMKWDYVYTWWWSGGSCWCHYAS